MYNEPGQRKRKKLCYDIQKITLKASITTVADDIMNHLFFRENKALYKQTANMKSQIIFYLKKIFKNFRMLSAILFGTL